MNCIKKESRYEFKEKKSLFIGIAFPIRNREDFANKLNNIKKEFPDANHHCYAYRVLINNSVSEYYSDDGEPSNSAGKPILAPIKGKELINTAVIVVRYFGGIKLGIGGLIHAYSLASSEALNKANILPFILLKRITIIANYNKINPIKNILKKYGTITDEEYTDFASITADIPEKDIDIITEKINNITKGKGIIKYE